MKSRPLMHLSLVPARAYQPTFSRQCHRPLSYACTARPTNRRDVHNHSRYTSATNAHPVRPCVRYASSAATARKSATPPYSTNLKTSVPAKSSPFTPPVPQVLAKLNPPPETYAPDLQIPSQKDESFVKYLWRCGRLYIAFYKQGIRNVRSTLKLARALRAKAEKTKVQKGDWHTVLTRAEWQIVRRSAVDKLRVPAFGALLLVFGEWLPLLALYITPVVPEPCRIPAQIQRLQRKTEQRRAERERRLAIDAARLVARDRTPGATSPGSIRPQAIDPKELDKLDHYSLLSLDARFGIQPKVWDWLFLTPPKGLLKYGLAKRLGYLRRDDFAIKRDGGFQALNQKEVERACMERGIRVLGTQEWELRRKLAAWFSGDQD